MDFSLACTSFGEENVNYVSFLSLKLSYYLDESSVEWASGSPPDDEVEISGSRSIPRGYGSDSGGGNTAGLLKHIRDNYGPVNSFTGTYRADTWTLDISAGSWGHGHLPTGKM